MNSIINYYNNEKIFSFMNGLANESMIFQSEAQFQHILARIIANDTEKDKNYEILLEYWTNTDQKIKNKRCYTDIVIMDTNSKEYIAIELKYKTAEAEFDTSYGKIKLTPQGANDYGCYDYLWDVQRIQNLICEESKGNLSNCTCVGGYAIFLTNEKKYWEYTNENKKDKNRYFMFCIGHESNIIRTENLKWMKDGKEYNDENNIRNAHIKLECVKDEKFKWQSYCSKEDKSNKNNGKFQFLCLEVEPKEV